MIPAFGIPAAEIDLLSKKGCIVVDTTCGSVLNVWKNVERYARAGVTSVIHGKFEHEETEATFSRTTLFAGAHYLVIRDKKEAGLRLRLHRQRRRQSRVHGAISQGDVRQASIRICIWSASVSPIRQRCSVPSRWRLRKCCASRWRKRYGAEELAERFHSFDTICSATQDRQDAVRDLERRAWI